MAGSPNLPESGDRLPACGRPEPLFAYFLWERLRERLREWLPEHLGDVLQEKLADPIGDRLAHG